MQVGRLRLFHYQNASFVLLRRCCLAVRVLIGTKSQLRCFRLPRLASGAKFANLTDRERTTARFGYYRIK
jgi:hypothetical protein